MEFPHVALMFSSLFSHRPQKPEEYAWILKKHIYIEAILQKERKSTYFYQVLRFLINYMMCMDKVSTVRWNLQILSNFFNWE